MVSKITDDTLHTVLRRWRYLTTLLGSPKSKSELIDALENPRSTVDRAVRDLESIGAVERTADGYGTTSLGRLAYREVLETRQKVECILKCTNLLQTGISVDKLSTELFRGTDVVRPTIANPNAPLYRLHSLVRAATSVRIMSPFVLTSSVRIYHDDIMNGDLQAEFLLSPAAVAKLVSEHDGELTDVIKKDSVTLFETSGIPPFELALVQENTRSRVVVLLQSSDGVSGLLSSSHRSAREWGNRTYDRYKRQSQKLEISTRGM